MENKNKIAFITKLIVAFVIILLSITAVVPNLLISRLYAQSGTEVKCGSIVDGEFTKEGEIHEYSLNMATRGQSFNMSIDTDVDYLSFWMGANGPTGGQVVMSGWNHEKDPSMSTGILTKGTYKIQVKNLGIGPYNLYIGCVTLNGEVKPGDLPQPTPTPAPFPTATVRAAQPETQPEFTGIGFPGLAPVDFADIGSAPLVLDVPNVGRLPKGNEILGFTVDAEAEDVLDLSYTRVSGNMNLGLVVLSADNQVYFQASLVTSQSLNTRFTLPTAGQYTIGVFRISLVEPEKVSPTVFQIKGSLNPVK